MKWSILEVHLNRQIMYMCVFMILLCLAGAIATTIWNVLFLPAHRHDKAWYLFERAKEKDIAVHQPAWEFILVFFYFFLLLNSFIPVSLYVSMTSVKFIQSYFMNHDLKMYHADSNTSCQVRTMALNEELGQVDYVLSDKTGTLTCNVMEFRKCSIQGIAYGVGETEVGLAVKLRRGGPEKVNNDPLHQDHHHPIVAPFVHFEDDSIFAADPDMLASFWEHLSLCHSVMPEKAPDGSLRMSASSPDEQALVAAAACFGFTFFARSPGEAKVERKRSHQNNTKLNFSTSASEDDSINDDTVVNVYKILDVLEFNSTRKRMSVIVEKPDGSLWVLCKGADSVIYDRLAVGYFFEFFEFLHFCIFVCHMNSLGMMMIIMLDYHVSRNVETCPFVNMYTTTMHQRWYVHMIL